MNKHHSPTRRRICLAAGALLASAPMRAMAQDEDLDDHAAGRAALDAALDASRVRHGVPAMGAVVLRGARILYLGVAGQRSVTDDTPVARDASWHLGSNTKAMTALVMARLVDRGVLSWDAALGDVWPDVNDAWRGVLITDLLHHRAGLMDRGLIDVSWLMSARQDERSLPEQRAAFARAALGAPPAAEPGAFAYGNANYLVAGAALEQITGMPWEALMADELFAPLGITTGGFGAPSGEASPLGHRAVGETLAPVEADHPGSDNPRALGPAGTAHMSLADYAKVLAIFADEGQTHISAASRTRLMTSYAGEERDYALGWLWLRERRWAEGAALAHEGSNTLWHTFAALSPRSGLAVAVCANAGGPGAAACQGLGQSLIQTFAA
ncbi:MAG: serine hydrolase domain-containing protein [Brevundimonas sp.]|jgi:D-alanyl-D-alanine carboxypeptidase|uniref:serine hydrolase domain-containing protein n=1 Tax=Brevundimonas sp. TaxID=1871086 RepID=UPI00391A6134